MSVMSSSSDVTRRCEEEIRRDERRQDILHEDGRGHVWIEKVKRTRQGLVEVEVDEEKDEE
jgi:hypothetical protein